MFLTKLCTLPLHVKDVDTTGRKVVVYASAFGNVDSDKDIVMPGAFAKTLSENGPQSSKPRIKHLLQHDSWTQIGKPQEMKEDATGLLCTSLILNTTAGNDALELYKNDLFEHSIGYQVIKYTRDENTGITQLTELKLYEISSVCWGANSETPLVGMKSLSPREQLDHLGKRWGKITKALRTGNLTEETYQTLELESEQIQSAYTQLIESLTAKQQPDLSTVKEAAKPTTEVDIAMLFQTFRQAARLN